VAVKFLSEEWASTVTDALNAHEGFKGAMGANELTLQFNVSDGPDGDVAYYMQAAGGTATVALGTVDGADVTVGQTYDTAAAISKGELNTQTAFMTGKLKVSGNLAKLMMNQAAIMQWQNATAAVDIEY
jgi:putative sterol carrier protein